jgi:hypothetical protein
MPINSRTKGHSWERELARQFREMGWEKAIRNLEYQDNELCGKDLAGTAPYIIQAKCTKKYVSMSTFDEIKPKDGEIPLLIAKANNKEVLAVMRWEDLKKIIKKPPQPFKE